MSKPVDQGKRGFLKGTAVVAGGAVLPFSASALAGTRKAKKAVYKAPLFDPTLENYPGYSANIAAPAVQQVAHNVLDVQLLV